MKTTEIILKKAILDQQLLVGNVYTEFDCNGANRCVADTGP